jgi:2-polyprenyl-6-methoxyphenol hydroxylase-like FAD-dependent oxidoreductase
MGSIVVCGGSVIGLSVASMLARDGHQVTILESDSEAAPDVPRDAWESWTRKGVAQFHQPHNLFPRVRAVADAELPGLTDGLLQAGCVWVNPLATRPPSIEEWSDRPDDDRFRFVTGRRPVVETVVATYAARQPGVEIRRGVKVAGLLGGSPAMPGVPHVVGVRTTDGEQIPADLVVDAMGRRTPIAAWLADFGARPPHVESEDSGFVYYTMYFAGPDRPVPKAPGLTPMGSISVLTLSGDNDTWSLTLFGTSRDVPLKALRDPARFTAVVQKCARHAHWLEGEPITGVLAMAGVVDRYHRFVVEGEPVVTGLAAVGDAWACTNPSAGRGVSVGITHAQQLRGAVREHLDDPAGFAHDWDQRTEQVVAPFYRQQIANDRARFAEMTALQQGQEPPAPNPQAERLMTAVGTDQDVFRALIEMVGCLATQDDVMARPEIQAKLAAVTPNGQLGPPGPDRRQLLEILSD